MKYRYDRAHLGNFPVSQRRGFEEWQLAQKAQEGEETITKTLLNQLKYWYNNGIRT